MGNQDQPLKRLRRCRSWRAMFQAIAAPARGMGPGTGGVKRNREPEVVLPPAATYTLPSDMASTPVGWSMPEASCWRSLVRGL